MTSLKSTNNCTCSQFKPGSMTPSTSILSNKSRSQRHRLAYPLSLSMRIFLPLNIFLHSISGFNVINEVLSVVRTTRRDLSPKIKEDDLKARLNNGDSSTALSSLLEYNLERFLQTHVIRLTLPTGVTASVPSNARSSDIVSGNTIDINITRAIEETTGSYFDPLHTL